MVKVPIYQSEERLRPDFRVGVDVRASAGAFGADIGRGVQDLAQGVMHAAEATARVQALDDATRAKDADNAYADWMRERMYGEGGFMTLEGRNAVDSRASFEREAEEKRKEFGKSLTGGAARSYHDASSARLRSTKQQSIVHTMGERKTWVKSASTSRMKTFADDALANYDKPGAVAKSMAAGIAEVRERGALEGWDADTLKLSEATYVSSVHRGIADRIAQTDAIAADAYLKSNKDRMTADDHLSASKAIEKDLKQEQSKREADAILQSGRGGSQPAPSRRVGESGPTNTRAFLIERLVSGHGRSHVDELDEHFAVNLGAMLQDAPPEIAKGLGILSGHRSVDRQAQLWAEALRKYGSPEAARKWVAPPGRSKHNHGQAVDLAYNGRSLANAPQHVVDWVHQNAGRYGLHFPMAHENWHIEPMGTRSGTVAPRSDAVARRSGLPSFGEIEDRVSHIKDGDVRDLTRKRIFSAIEMQSKADAASERAAKDALWNYIDQGATPDQVPPEIRRAAGMAAVSSAWGYMETEAKGRAVENDETLLYGMRRHAAANPSAFAELDLNDYRDRLSKEAIKELTGLQTATIRDSRKTAEDGVTATSAFRQAEQQLAAVGLTTAGLSATGAPTKRMEMEKRIAQFQNTLFSEIDGFRKTNSGRQPNQAEVQAMINRLLMPIVIRQPGWIWDSKTEARAFEAATRPDGSSVDVTVKYGDIPIDLRRGISVDLERELGRKPSPEEITTRYEAFALGR